MNKKKLISLISIVIILFLFALPKLIINKSKNLNSPQSNPRSQPLVVKGIIIKEGYLQNKIFSNGTLMSNEEVELRTEIAGKITQILFEEGKYVKKGELLLKINDAELQATLKKNKSRETLARDKEYRYKQLLEKNLTSQQDYDVALGELNSVLADIEYTQAQIEKTEIRAPFDGIIGLRSVSVGSYISPQTRIATLQSINPMKVDFAVPQKYFGLIKPGKTVYIKISSTGKTYTGKVYAVEPKIDPNTRSVQVRAIVPNEKGELTPGAYVEIEIVLEEFNNAILVPSETIVPDIEGEKVFVYRNGKAVPQIVSTGIRTEKEVQILGGLNIGDTLIVSGIIQIKPNAPVRLSSVN
ncbi:efflux RND transporter periplasmic adaptor subunit [Rosettibacter firmus]|uniref:efflux RND transporter periplasmic adaptor subunit n=1 Tax=Rosettibacter firmus TaxID=3111522 RepID=UPI00336BFA49